MKSEKVKSKKEIRIEKKVSITTFLFSLFSFLLLNCTSVIQKGGEFLEGGAFSEKTSVTYRTADKGNRTIILKELKAKDGTEAIEITSSEWPGLALRGTLPAGGLLGSSAGDKRVELSTARILSSHVHGWNEFNLDLLGSAVFSEGTNRGVLRMDGEVERVQISSGQIRLKSSRLSGEAALTALRNRRDRIIALAEWMNEWLQNSPSIVFNNKSSFTQNDFEAFFKPILFPELVSVKKRNPEYQTDNVEWKRADSVKWNISYTEKVFPENLREYRNSGAMLRDWEEALFWIYVESSWEYIINSFNGIELSMTKQGLKN